ncbi:hypothetical protein Tco_0431140 [Tanacetum coccineum]
MRELREDTFLRNKNDDAHEHVERILDIVSLFNIPGVTHDVVILRVFPITLTRAAKRWVDRLPPGTINTWDLLKKDFIQRSGYYYDERDRRSKSCDRQYDEREESSRKSRDPHRHDRTST